MMSVICKKERMKLKNFWVSKLENYVNVEVCENTIIKGKLYSEDFEVWL